jgi:Ca-activated chloride channel homolog
MTVQPWRRMALAVLAVLAAAGSVRAQGIIIDRRTIHPIARSYEVREVILDARVRDQVAEVQVSQTFHNPGSFPIDAEYLFPMPEEGAVQNFVLLVDGQELPGRLLPKDEARRIYEEIVRTRRDPALLEYMGRGLYRTSVFPIPPGADRKVTMRYTQLCKRDRDVVEFAYPLSTQKFTAKPIQRLSLTLRLESRAAIKSLYCPTYDARIDRSGDHEAKVSWEQRDTIPSADFRLITTLAEGRIGASVLSYRPGRSDDGYFLLLASPEVKIDRERRQPKTVIFVLDRSGSMAGKKIEQARNALRFVLNNLRDDDLFNIVVYDDRVETFKPELQRYSPGSRDEAVRYVDNIREGGSTNIDAALKEALGQIRNDDRPSYAIFLTDGLPTAGEVGEAAITDHCHASNRYRTRLFAFGVGYDVNARLLDRLSGGNSGTSEYVKPDDDIEAHVAKFYGRMTSPVLADVRVELEGSSVNRTYPRDIPDLFEGGQLVLAGRYTRSGRTTIKVSGKIAGERKSFEFPAELADSYQGSRFEFVEKLWATRRVGDLIDQIDLHGQNKELVDELVALSTKYGLLTPYTSFLADDRVQLHASAANAIQTRQNLESLNVVSGPAGVAQRDAKQSYKLAEREVAPTPFDAAGIGGYGYGGAQPGQNAPGSLPALAKAAAPQPGLAYDRMARGGRGATAQGMGGGMMAGMMGRMGAMGGQPAIAGKPEARRNLAENVRQMGTKTFFRKDNRWVDSTVKPEDEAKAIVVRQFSDEFFKLAREQTSELNQYLTFDEAVTVRLGSQVYRIEMAAK